MKGSYRVIVYNNRVRYDFTVTRNITVIQGLSATGKTTLINLIRDFEENGRESGITVACDRSCTVVSGRGWADQLESISGSLVFIDEGNGFVTSPAFARIARDSDNYYVIVAREAMPNLPYSVNEIYGIKNTTRKKKPEFNRLYSSFKKLYGDAQLARKPEVVIVEDSNAGYEFFRALFEGAGIQCVSANGKAKIGEAVLGSDCESVLVIADGAAFGSEIEILSKLNEREGKSVSWYLPESFEWLILKSGLIEDGDIQEILADASAYIESSEYFSWEQFFTELLVERTKSIKRLRYKKDRLNKAYLEPSGRAAIEGAMPDLGI